MACRCEFQERLMTLHSRLYSKSDRLVYLDYNATTPVDPRVLGAFERSCRQTWGNPSSLHRAGITAFREMEEARTAAAAYFGTDPAGIHFCGSGSEAIHAGLAGYLALHAGALIVTTQLEHASVKDAVLNLAAGENILYAAVDSEGKIDLGKLRKALEERDISQGLIAVVSPVNHETGSLQPASELAALIKRTGAGGKTANRGGLVFFDGVQAAARLAPESWVPHCSMFAVSGHKMYAPKGSAVLWKEPAVELKSFRYGGNQEWGMFPGTENTPAIAAFAEALRLKSREFADEERHLLVLTEELRTRLAEAAFPCILESPESCAPGILCISLPWAGDMEEVLAYLSGQNICVSRFSACTGGVQGESDILRAMGRPRERLRSSLRISLGKWSRRDDLLRFEKALTSLYSRS